MVKLTDEDTLLKVLAAGGAGWGLGFAVPKKYFHDQFFNEKEPFSYASNRYSAAINGCYAATALALAKKDVPKKTKKTALKAAGVALLATSANAAYNSLKGNQHREFGLANSAVLGGFGAFTLAVGFKKD